MKQSQQQMRNATSAESQLSRLFKERVLDVRSTSRMWHDADVRHFCQLAAAAYSQLVSDPSRDHFEYKGQIDPSLVELFHTTQVRLYDGDQLHIGGLLTTTQQITQPSPLLKFKIFSPQVLFDLMSEEAISHLKTISEQQATENRHQFASMRERQPRKMH